jgi:hypothetical protein
MTTYEFEVQCYKKVRLSYFDNPDDARSYLIDHLDEYDLLDDPCVSNGIEIKTGEMLTCKNWKFVTCKRYLMKRK